MAFCGRCLPPCAAAPLVGLLFAALPVLALQSAAAGQESPAPGAASRGTMQEVLARIAADAARTSPYWGTEPRDEAARRLERARRDGSPEQLETALHDLADEELRLGAEMEAIDLLLEARRRAQERDDREALSRALLRLGVAYLRLAESRNCAQNHNADACIVPIRGAGVHRDRGGSEQAIASLEAYLALTSPRSVSYLQGLWLLNLAYMTLGEWPASVPDALTLPASAFGGEGEMPRLVNVAPELGMDSFNLSGSMVVDDFDGDLDLDVFTTSFDPAVSARFFVGDGRGGFADRSQAAGLEGVTGGLNAVHADYDNDGDLDVFVLRGAWLGEDGAHPNSLLRNDGGGRFTDVTFAEGLAEPWLPTQTAAWADFDLDGDLDLFVGNEHDARIDAPSQLFRNDGPEASPRFVDVARAVGIDVRAYVKAAVWGDIDLDGDPDLFLSVLGDVNRLYVNEPQDGSSVRFREVAEVAGIQLPRQSFPAWFWDYDNDGALDLYVSSYRGDRGGVGLVAASAMGFPGPWELARLYRGDGRGGFRDRAEDLGLRRLHLAMGSNFGDLDGDGFLDFYLGTGYPDYEAIMPNALYQSQSGNGFVDVTLSSGLGHLQKGHAVAFADYDRDGDLDVFEQMGGAYPGDSFGDALFRNPGSGARHLRLRLEGRRTNRSALGARIRVVTKQGGRERSIYRHVSSGGSFGGSPLTQTIGLGRADEVVRVEVLWPVTGRTETFSDVTMDRGYVVVEGEERLREESVGTERQVGSE